MNDTKSKILDSARNLFEEYGYKKVSMDEIASNACVTKKTVYSYFKDKETLLKTILEEEIHSMGSIIEKYSSDSSLSFFEILNKSLYALLDYKKNNKLLIRLNKDSSIFMENIMNIVDDSIIGFIKDKLLLLKNRSDIKTFDIDVDLCSFIIYKVYVAIMFEYDKEIDEELLTRTVTSILKDGLFKEG